MAGRPRAARRKNKQAQSEGGEDLELDLGTGGQDEREPDWLDQRLRLSLTLVRSVRHG